MKSISLEAMNAYAEERHQRLIAALETAIRIEGMALEPDALRDLAEATIKSYRLGLAQDAVRVSARMGEQAKRSGLKPLCKPTLKARGALATTNPVALLHLHEEFERQGKSLAEFLEMLELAERVSTDAATFRLKRGRTPDVVSPGAIFAGRILQSYGYDRSTSARIVSAYLAEESSNPKPPDAIEQAMRDHEQRGNPVPNFRDDRAALLGFIKEYYEVCFRSHS